MVTDKIEKTVHLRAPRRRVWRALTDSQEFGSWFGMRFDGPFVKGATVQAVIASSSVDPGAAQAAKDYAGLTFPLLVESLEPERLFSFRWHPYSLERGVDYSREPTTRVTFELADEPGGTLLTVTESGFDRIPVDRRAKAFSANEGGWTIQLHRIEKHLSTAG